MGKVIEFRHREEVRNNSPKNIGTVGLKVTQITKKTLPIDIGKLRESTNGSPTFLIKLQEEGVVNIALDEEVIDMNSRLRVLGENDESWDLTLGEFIEVMLEKPASTSHEDLKFYITNLLGGRGIEVIYNTYSPDTESKAYAYINESDFQIILKIEIVGDCEGQRYQFSVRTHIGPESVSAHPDEFKDPMAIPVSFLLIQYFMGTLYDNRIAYGDNSPVEILRVHRGILFIITTTYGKLRGHILDMIYEKMPHYRKFNNGNIAIEKFHGTQISQFLR